MWALLLNRYVAGALAVLVALLASFAAGAHWRNVVWEAKYQTDLVKMYQAGIKANQKATEDYRANLAAISQRPPARRVLLCPSQGTPTGGVAGAGPADVQGQAQRDIGPGLAAIADDADRCAAQLDALIEAVR